MHIIEATRLSYRFSRNDQRVLNNIHLAVKEGSIYGFLGPNGAGKTTTLRLILGLLRKQQGDISIFGEAFGQRRVELLRRIGSLIESPSVYGHLTATENLAVWQKVFQCPRSRIAEVLKIVGLQDTGAKKARQFSLGMKQRLGIAAALLHQPDLLILDEPTNGLDPAGIVEMRELLKKLNKEQGITILISSHLLPEIEKLATDVGIIHRGQMLFQGTLEALMQRQRQASRIVMETGNNAAALQLLSDLQIPARLEDSGISLATAEKSVLAGINRQLVQQGIDVWRIAAVEEDLESVFMNLTNNN